MKRKNIILFSVILFYTGLNGPYGQTMKDNDCISYKTVTIGKKVVNGQ